MSEGEDDMDTARMETVRWLDPVGTREQLPSGDGLAEGCLCYVQADETVWQLRAGQWVQVERRPAGEP